MTTTRDRRLARRRLWGLGILPPVALALFLLGPGTAKAESGERFVALSAAERLRVTEVGSGPPVVIIPGLFGCAYAFRGLLSELARAGFHGLVIEPLGVGGSSKPGGLDYSLTAQADRVASVLVALELPPAVVVAHAVGASIAFRLAWRHPERVAAVVSLDGGPAEAATTPGFRRAMRWAPVLKLFGGVRRMRGPVRATLVERSADPRWVTDEVLDGYMEPLALDLDATLRAFRGMADSREPAPLRDRLSGVRCPVLLLVGGWPHEGGPSPAEIDLLRERLPRFALESVPGVGHFVFEEAPGAVVAAVGRSLNPGRRATRGLPPGRGFPALP